MPVHLTAAFLLASALTGCASTRPAEQQGPISTRYFVQVGGLNPGHILASTGPGHGWSGMVEYDTAGRSISDTLRVWIQHCGRTACAIPDSVLAEADMFITCYPNNTAPAFRVKHVFPYYNDLVYLYVFSSSPVWTISAGRVPEYDAHIFYSLLNGVIGRPPIRLHLHD